jgi:selT/selW/selH-like putative selenoprotein
MGENARQVFYFLPHHYISYITERKWQLGLMAFFIGSLISNFISSTGAFEIFVNNKQIWSRLSTNNVPSFEFLVDRISKLGYNLKRY